jgi:putative ABC transport system permease protein
MTEPFGSWRCAQNALRRSRQIDVREADIWVMDPRVDYVDEVEAMTNTQLGRVRGVDGVDWAVPFFKGLTVAHTRDGQLEQVILLGVDDATLMGVAPRMVLGSVANLKQPDAMMVRYSRSMSGSANMRKPACWQTR